jgi:hypothetical protein
VKDTILSKSDSRKRAYLKSNTSSAKPRRSMQVMERRAATSCTNS